MTDLTEQWKKGGLPSGWYWVEYSVDGINGVEMMKYIPELNGFSFTIIKQVLAPVPTFEEWKKAYECVVSENEQLTTLKEALKDCQEKILLMDYDSIKIEILQKIDEVLNA